MSRKYQLCISSVLLICLINLTIFYGNFQNPLLNYYKFSAFGFILRNNNETREKVEDIKYYNASSNNQSHVELTTQRPTERIRYVSFDKCVNDGRRIGNLLFDLATVIFVAELSGRKPVLDESLNISLETTFKLNLERVKGLCPCHTIGESRHLAYDINTEKIAFNDSKLANKTILVAGFRQSWRYTLSIERRLRKHLVFREEIQNFAEGFLQSAIPSGWRRAGFVRVGVHSRRGDNLVPHFRNYGYTVPDEAYFHQAMKHFTDKYSRVQFIVSSDDSKWARQHIVNINNLPPDTINVTYTVNNTAGQDFAILSLCDHVIMSTGTFGWWAAWMAKGTTIYYADWPRKGSALEGHFNRNDFFPPNWIPMTSKK